MFSRVRKVFIGTNINRLGSLTTINSATVVPQVGEILILDSNRNIMTAGETFSDTQSIYVAQGLSDTFSVTNANTGTALTGVRHFFISNAIDGRYVMKYFGQPYVGKNEQITTIPYATGVTIGTEYVLRFVFKDLKEHPGQFVLTYHTIATSTNSDTLYTAWINAINADPNARVSAVLVGGGSGTGSLVLTGLPIPQCTTGLNDIDEYHQVFFQVFPQYVSTTDYITLYAVSTNAAISTVNAFTGYGIWELVRDDEKFQFSTRGITNRIWFPVIMPSFSTVVGTNYNSITIDSDNTVKTPDNNYLKTDRQSAVIYLPVGAGQTQNILAVLNPWMASLPVAQNNIQLI